MIVCSLCLLCIGLLVKAQADDQPHGPAKIEPANATASEGVTKTWSFDVGGDKLNITARSVVPAPKYFVLSIVAAPVKTVARLPLREVVKCLSEVAEQLPSVGIDPKSVVYIYLTGIFDIDTQRQLAIAAARSKKFQKQTRRNGFWEAGGSMVRLMNSFSAYKEFDKAFERYGTMFEVCTAEETLGVRISDLGITNLPSDISPKTIVPCTSTLTLVTQKKARLVPETGSNDPAR